MNDLTGIEAMQALTINKMLIRHMNAHIEQGLELAIHAFRWPTKYLRVIHYQYIPRKELVLDSPGLFSTLIEIELKPNPIDSMTIDTYIGGDIAEFMTYNMIKGGETK